MEPATAVAAAAAAVQAAVAGGIAIAAAVREGKLKKKLDQLEKQGGGLSQAERRQAVQQANQAAGQQAGQAQAQIARDSMADKGGRNFSQYAQAQKEVGQFATNAGAQASAQVDALSQQVAQQRRNELLQRLGMAGTQTTTAMQGAAQQAGQLANQFGMAGDQAALAKQLKLMDPNSGEAAVGGTIAQQQAGQTGGMASGNMVRNGRTAFTPKNPYQPQ